MPDWLLPLAALLVGGGGVLAWLKLGPENRRTNADATVQLEVARSSILEMIQEGTEGLRRDLGAARGEIDTLRDKVRDLEQAASRDRDHRHQLRNEAVFRHVVAEQAVEVLRDHDDVDVPTLPQPLRAIVDGTMDMPEPSSTDRRGEDVGPPAGFVDRRTG